MRRCHVCKIELVNYEPWRWRCKACNRKQGQQRRKANPEHQNKIAREWYRKNGKRLRWQNKLEFIAAYGSCCICCGEREPRFLTAEHLRGNGAAHRRELGNMATGGKFYSVLKRLGWPKDEYSLLCFNCNAAKHLYGICPHHTVRAVNA